MKNKSFLVGGAICLLALMLMPGLGQAGMWVGLQGGANWTADTDVRTPAGTGWSAETFPNVKRDVAALGGIIIGYDFVKEGFLGYNYPEWMKYFSFCTDFTYNRATSRSQTVYSVYDAGFTTPEEIHMEMSLACWSFLFKARYGFFPDSEVPFGRLQPYLMVGPGILFSSVRADFFYGATGSHASSVDIALVTEAGIRWMALKNVSLDAGFRYRYAKPSYDLHLSGGRTTDMTTELHLFTAMFRVSYHF